MIRDQRASAGLWACIMISCATRATDGAEETTSAAQGESTTAGSETPAAESPSETACSIEIEVRDGGRFEHEVPAGDALTIGRESFTDITIARSAVSRRHARVSSEAGRCFIEDTDSTNGVYVNDIETPIDVRTEVGPDDAVFVGPARLRIAPR